LAFFGDGPVQIVDPFGDKELSLLFFTMFLSILISGGGYCVHRAIGGRKKKYRSYCLGKYETPKISLGVFYA
jgi:hypothetical protein